MKKNIVGLLLLSSVVSAGDFSRDSVNNVVLDYGTNLMWQDDTTPSTMNWELSIDYCENLTLAGYSDWRLPNYNELLSIIDRSNINPLMDSKFQNVVADEFYWSSTTLRVSNLNDEVFLVKFNSGSTTYKEKGYGSYVRCVRDN